MFKMAAKAVLVLMLLCLIYRNESSYIKRSQNKPKLVIDFDGGADDAMAIFMSLLYEKYFDGPEVLGLTTTNGNVNESQGFKNCQRILDVAKRRDVPIYRGCSRSLVITQESDYFFGKDGLGDNKTVKYKDIAAQSQHAVIALVELSKEYLGNLIILAIGPLTNIALAIRLDPGFLGRLSHLYIGAGHVYSSNFPDTEFNAAMDAESYRIVTESATPEKVTVIPFSQIKDSLNITKEWRIEVLGKIPTEIMKAQNSFEQIALAKIVKWSMLDPAAAAITLYKQVVHDIKRSNNSIILCGKDRGINTNDFASLKPNVQLVNSITQDVYKKLLIDIFSAELTFHISNSKNCDRFS